MIVINEIEVAVLTAERWANARARRCRWSIDDLVTGRLAAPEEAAHEQVGESGDQQEHRQPDAHEHNDHYSPREMLRRRHLTHAHREAPAIKRTYAWRTTSVE